MIDRKQLTEALASLDSQMRAKEYVEPGLGVLMKAARLLLAFPTDEQVEAAVAVIDEEGDCGKAGVRAALEAVRRVMYGED